MPSVAALAARREVPLLAEPSSNARIGPAAMATGRLLLASGLAEEIERVVVFGHPTLSRPVSRLLARDDVELVVVSAYADWIDPGRMATVVGDAVRFAGSRATTTGWAAGRRPMLSCAPSWTRCWPGCRYFSGPVLAARLWSGADRRRRAVRRLLLAGPRSRPGADQRGLRPPCTPTAAWPASTAACRRRPGSRWPSERPTHALLGDLTALHDLTGLPLPDGEPRPDLRLVVANDDGGSIFATLEPGAAGAQRRVRAAVRHSGTRGLRRPGRRRSAAATRRSPRPTELSRVLAEPPAGIELVEAVIDRAHRRTLDAEITALAATL